MAAKGKKCYIKSILGTDPPIVFFLIQAGILTVISFYKNLRLAFMGLLQIPLLCAGTSSLMNKLIISLK